MMPEIIQLFEQYQCQNCKFFIQHAMVALQVDLDTKKHKLRLFLKVLKSQKSFFK